MIGFHQMQSRRTLKSSLLVIAVSVISFVAITSKAVKPVASIPMDSLENVRLVYLKNMFLSLVFKPDTDPYLGFETKFWDEIKGQLQRANYTIVSEERAEDAKLQIEGFVANVKSDKVLILRLEVKKEFPARVAGHVFPLPATIWSRQTVILDPEHNRAQIGAEIKRMVSELLTDRAQGEKLRLSLTSQAPKKKK